MSTTRRFLFEILGSLKEEVVSLLTKDLNGVLEKSFCRSRIERLLEYTIGNGKFLRSCLAFDTYNALAPDTSHEHLLRVGKVAITLELLQAHLLIMDDVIDNASIRRRKPCWHTLPDIGLSAINDGLLLDSSIDLVIRNSIPTHPNLEDIIRTIYDTKRKTVIGQYLDCGTNMIEQFTWARYKAIVDNKTSHYTYYLPLTTAFKLADRYDSPRLLHSLAYKIGYLFQAQDDYLDCFGDVNVTGKSSNDIRDGKCTWMTCKFLEKARNSGNLDKIKMFCNYFGKCDPENVDKAREMIREENVDQDFKHFQINTIKDLHADIEKFPIKGVQKVLHHAIDNLTDRQK